MKKQVLGLVSVFALFASSSAMAASDYNSVPKWQGIITADELVARFCQITAVVDGTLGHSTDTGNEFKHLSGGTALAGSGNKGKVTVKSGGLTTHLTLSELELLKSEGVAPEEAYDDAELSAGFNGFPGVESLSTAETKVDLSTSPPADGEEFFVWFFAKRTGSDDAIFEPGSYRGVTTVTCEAGTKDGNPVVEAGVQNNQVVDSQSP